MPYVLNNKLSSEYKEGWLEITDDLYRELLIIKMGGNPQYIGFLVENNEVIKIERNSKKEKIPKEIPYSEIVKRIKDRIDREAGNTRLRYITEAPGQTGVYLEKMYQASRYIENLPTNMDGYEYIVGEAEARNISYLAAANLIKDIADYWNKQISPAIEKIRIEAKNEIDLLDETDDIELIKAIGENAIDQLRTL